MSNDGMIPTFIGTLAAAFAVSAFFATLGLPLARVLAPAGVAPVGMAATLGWAVFSAVSLPILGVIGFGRLHIAMLAAAGLAASLAVLAHTGRGERLPPRMLPSGTLPSWALPLAGAAALLPMMAVLPKQLAGGLVLSSPMFDHVKIAIVDGILRSGLPVQNPFLEGAGSPLAYYYLWHFSAAEVASVLGSGGWAADAAMTGVTAFSSLALAMAVAQAIGGRLACPAVVLVSLAGTLRPLLDGVLGRPLSGAFVRGDADLGGWLIQAAWVPQHLASACCVVAAVLAMLRMAQGGGTLAIPLLGIVSAAGFESSTWVGGVTFAAAAPAAALVLIRPMPPPRWRYAARLAASALVTVAFARPFMLGQFGAVADRAAGMPIALVPYRVLGGLVPEQWRQVLDIPAFWLVLLPASLPAIAWPGLVGMTQAIRRGGDGPLARVLAATVVACLGVAFLLRSTIDNNDLGWRAVLPPVILLTCFAAALLARLAASRRWGALAAVLVCVAAGLPDGVGAMRADATGRPAPYAAALAQSAKPWDALRRATEPSERIANNPLFLAGATPWPVNISWALLADRPSCFAGWESVIAYGALPRARIAALDAMVARVFGGAAQPGDVAGLAWTLDCQAVLVLPHDGAWTADPFASSPDYALMDSGAGRWRIYRRRPGVAATSR